VLSNILRGGVQPDHLHDTSRALWPPHLPIITIANPSLLTATGIPTHFTPPPGDDLLDYEDDITAGGGGSFNILRCYVHLYGRDAALHLARRIGQLEAERERLLAALPPEQRPTTAAYPTLDDPFAGPVVVTVRYSSGASAVISTVSATGAPATITLPSVTALKPVFVTP